MAGKTKAPIRMVMSWFVDCSACKKSYPTVNAVRAAFAEDQLAIFGFNNAPDDSKTAMAEGIKKFGVRYVNLEDRTAADVTAFKALAEKVLKPTSVKGNLEKASAITPITLFLDASGNVLYSMYSFPTVSETVKILHDLEAHH